MVIEMWVHESSWDVDHYCNKPECQYNAWTILTCLLMF